MPDPVVHFEMPAKDKKRTASFYSSAFGWNMNQMGADMGDYLLAGSVDVDEKMMPVKSGAINGGFFEYKDEPGFNMPHLVISVDNLEVSIKKVEEAGGKNLGGSKGPGTVDDIPGIGKYVSIEDTEGNRVGMLEPLPMKK